MFCVTVSDQQVKIVLRIPPPDIPSPLVVSLPLESLGRGRKRERPSWQPIGPPSLEEVELTSSSEEDDDEAIKTPPTYRGSSGSGKVFHTTPPPVGKPSVSLGHSSMSRPSPSLGKPSSFIRQPTGKPYHYSRKSPTPEPYHYSRQSPTPEPKKSNTNLIVEINLDRLSHDKKAKKHKSAKPLSSYEVVPPVLTTPPSSLSSHRDGTKKKKKKKHRHKHHHHKTTKSSTADSPARPTKKEPDPMNFSPGPVSLPKHKLHQVPNILPDPVQNHVSKHIPEPVTRSLPDPIPKPLSECLSPPSIDNIHTQAKEPIKMELEQLRPLNRLLKDSHHVKKHIPSIKDSDLYHHRQISSPAESSL